ncbi:hypothetical protein [Mesorhizobium sp. NZP2234]|uniref:hypothetical protein n=1 Tax=Mesorhizobium sp. NZP2234 TaxID=2483402 RepID=UPI001554BF64|nr:hypothetical protein [Mesorhizobium sp. NZP2234]
MTARGRAVSCPSAEGKGDAHLEKIILDRDPGYDDAIAILLAAGNPNIDLLGRRPGLLSSGPASSDCADGIHDRVGGLAIKRDLYHAFGRLDREDTERTPVILDGADVDFSWHERPCLVLTLHRIPTSSSSRQSCNFLTHTSQLRLNLARGEDLPRGRPLHGSVPPGRRTCHSTFIVDGYFVDTSFSAAMQEAPCLFTLGMIAVA